MAQVRSRQGLRAGGVRYLGLGALAIAILAGPAPHVRAEGQLAAADGAFDDWSPSGRTVAPPRARPAPSPTPRAAPRAAPTPTPGGRLGYGTILGLWCSPNSRYQIERRRLIVLLNDGRRVGFPVTGFTFKAATIEIRWTNKGVSKRSVFGRFSSNRRRMVQFGVNRTYNRC